MAKVGKSVDISNYVINENKDYTTKLTSDVVSNFEFIATANF